MLIFLFLFFWGLNDIAFAEDKPLDTKAVIHEEIAIEQAAGTEKKAETGVRAGVEQKTAEKEKKEKKEEAKPIEPQESVAQVVPDNARVTDVLSDSQLGVKSGLSPEELLKLKTENPDKYKQIMQQNREDALHQMEYLKANSPQRYKSVRERLEYKERGTVAGEVDAKERAREVQ